ncbi:hypothetical protein ARALYDRAFT_486214 [Arabidopsis lyrata subsp. lyrata]|uniref:Protein kinase domain-containing protein n=1 Tax=Arabidopsis lyrata subsp. lyrata TaxID=81972 RepID=D7LVV1_ARALL|nr:hypothetical protein ARALYDRAFT_486214 [Arabidopsis lyrata subsp. lyrata]
MERTYIKKRSSNLAMAKQIPSNSSPLIKSSKPQTLSANPILFLNYSMRFHTIDIIQVKTITIIIITCYSSRNGDIGLLVGCCLESEHPVLVYRALKKPSSLDLKTVVSWRQRLKIAEEIATALAYLHTAFPRPFVYRILRLEDILLDDEDGVAKLCNFSHCASIPQGETFVKLGSGCIGGDYDYMDDNYLINARDFVSFENRRKFAKSIDEIVDSKILEKIGEVTEEERCRMEAFIVLLERCIGLRGEVPKMVEVAKELKIFLRDSSSSSDETSL